MQADQAMRSAAATLAAVLQLTAGTAVTFAAEKMIDTAAIERITGLKGTMSEQEGVFKVTSP